MTSASTFLDHITDNMSAHPSPMECLVAVDLAHSRYCRFIA